MRAPVLPWLVVGVALATVAVGLTARLAGADWRAPAQPLILFWRPELSPWALPGLAVLGTALLATPRLARSPIGPLAFAAAAFGLTLLTRLALNVTRDGPAELAAVFDDDTAVGRDEYLAGLPLLDRGVGPFLESFDQLVAVAPVHVAGHPPGFVVALELLGIGGATGAAALTILAGALATPALYLLARRLHGEAAARVAAALFVFVPTSLLYGATSADALYAALGALAALGLLAARPAGRALGAAGLALASFFSYALLAVGAWAALVRWRREGVAAALRLALLCGAALLALYLGLYLVTGFDLLASVDATDRRYHEGIASRRPYLFYLFGSPAAFVVMLGPVAWFAARSLAARETTALALGAVVAVSAIAGYTKAETERIWLFLVPFACLAAARSVPARQLPPLLAALCLQAVVTQLLFFTKW